jgi:hypothetical protein
MNLRHIERSEISLRITGVLASRARSFAALLMNSCLNRMQNGLVIPAQAGIQKCSVTLTRWIPAFAGMTAKFIVGPLQGEAVFWPST